MTQADIIQQVVRILGFILTGYLFKLGFDEQSTQMLLTALGTLLGFGLWWVYWTFIKKA